MEEDKGLAMALMLGSAVVGGGVGCHYFLSNHKSGIGGAILGAGLSVAVYFAIVQANKEIVRKVTNKK